MRAEPRVLTGTRAGRGTEAKGGGDASAATPVHPGLYSRIAALMRGRNLIPAAKKAATPYDVVFGSRYSTHRIQVTSPEDIVDPKTGRKIKSRPIAVVFNKNLFSIPKKYTLEQANDILQHLRAHEHFGVGNEFWEAKDVANDAMIRDTVHVIEQLSANDAMREAALEFLNRGDYIEDETDGVGGVALGGARALGEDEDAGDAEDETGDVEGDDDEGTDDVVVTRRPTPAKSKKNAARRKNTRASK